MRENVEQNSCSLRLYLGLRYSRQNAWHRFDPADLLGEAGVAQALRHRCQPLAPPGLNVLISCAKLEVRASTNMWVKQLLVSIPLVAPVCQCC